MNFTIENELFIIECINNEYKISWKSGRVDRIKNSVYGGVFNTIDGGRKNIERAMNYKLRGRNLSPENVNSFFVSEMESEYKFNFYFYNSIQELALYLDEEP